MWGLRCDMSLAASSSIAHESSVVARERLGDAIAELAARLHAATCELLILLHQFDQARGWHCGFLSCAHWLSWRTGMDLGAAREKVRVARALADLPRIRDAMARGELSYSKVRALTRVATPAQEPQLLDLARAASAAQVERLVRAWRRVDGLEARQLAERRHLHRQVTMWVDEDGMLVIRGRLPPGAGAVVQQALEAAADRLYREAASPPADGVMAEVTAGQRRADALVLVAECALSADLDCGRAADRYQVVLHVDASTCASDPSPSVTETPHAVVALLDGAVHVSAETSSRIACDASVVVMRHGADGTVLDVGRKQRTPPAAIRRALTVRDAHCRFPGCTARRCDAHHLQPWALGGRTALGGLVLLCRRHHTLVHEGGFSIHRATNDVITVVRPDGSTLEATAPVPRWAAYDPRPLGPTESRLQAEGIQVGPETTRPRGSERLDVGWAIDVLRARRDALSD